VIDAVGNVQKVLLLGGTSEIGLAMVRRPAAERQIAVALAGRTGAGLDGAADGLRRDGHTVDVVAFDAEDEGTYLPAVDAAFAGGDVDVVVIAFGVLGDAEAAWQDSAVMRSIATVNYTAPVAVGVEAADRLRRQGRGAIVVLSSVAGERPRRSNFAYGSTKAGLDAFFTGLREALRPDGVRLLVVRPGFVTTKMTEGMKPAPLATTAEQVADSAVKALRAGRDTVWVPGSMRAVMSVLRHVPAPLFRRLPI
jgi:decaprenylphospho-beta-D-erythro-pentofuranosid-2-ulose 2-reductase